MSDRDEIQQDIWSNDVWRDIWTHFTFDVKEIKTLCENCGAKVSGIV